MISTNRGQRGFTLLEIMVALTILGISMVVLIEIFSNGLTAAHKNHDLNTAMLLAQSKMEQVLLERKFSEGEQNGTFDGMDNFHWDVAVKLWDYPPDLFLSTAQKDAMSQGASDDAQQKYFRIFEITVQISWNKIGKSNSYKVSTLRTMPPEQDELLQ